MNNQYALACVAYLEEYIKEEVSTNRTYIGWYHYIDSPDFHTVGAVATAQILILIKNCALNVSFDCMPMLESLLAMQNSDGGWSYRSNILTSATEPTSLAIEALLLWNDKLCGKQKNAVEKGTHWLLKYMNSDGLWGPVKKKEKRGYIFFSCEALHCLNRLSKCSEFSISEPLQTKVKCALVAGCKSLLKAFDNSDIQCGWGTAVDRKATLFHTAYTIITLLDVDARYIDRHPVIKSLAFLSDYLNKERLDDFPKTQFSDGMNEIYQSNKSRLVHTHSVDIYVLMALMCGGRETNNSIIDEKCKGYLECAVKTDWRYQGFVTCWRLYDVVSLCSKFERLMKVRGEKAVQHFKIALTFAGESRSLVEKVANALTGRFDKEEILYDKFHEARFARPQLDLYLQKLYHDCSDLIVVFLCEKYSQKRWCGVEWRAIRDILNNFRVDNIMYVKVGSENVDDISLPGFYGSEDGYVDANDHTPEEIAELIIQRYNETCQGLCSGKP